MKKTLSIIMAALMLFAMASFAFAEDAQTDLKVEIEGIKKTLFNGTVTVSKSASVLDVVYETGLDVVAEDSSYGGKYISSIGGDAAGTFGGWDGWLFELDGVESYLSVDQATVGDSSFLLFYYGDPYGEAGMQRPQADEHISDGYITFTSADTVTDWTTGESTTTVNPVADATVTFSDGTVLKTDETGKVNLKYKLQKAGNYTYTVEKYAESGLPLVLRTTGSYSVEGPDSFGLKVNVFFEAVKDWFNNIFQKIAALFNR